MKARPSTHTAMTMFTYAMRHHAYTTPPHKAHIRWMDFLDATDGHEVR